MDVRFSPNDAAILARAARDIDRGGRALAIFGEVDPELAAECGVEIGALEARTLVGMGAAQRVASAADEALGTQRPLVVNQADVEGLSRLGAVVALGNSRIQVRMAALQAEEAQGSVAELGSILGLATGAVGLIKSIF